MKKRGGAGSSTHWYESTDLDPYQNTKGNVSPVCVCSESLMVVNLNSGAEEEKIPLTSGDTLLGTYLSL
jgi:hypothetical protein